MHNLQIEDCNFTQKTENFLKFDDILIENEQNLFKTIFDQGSSLKRSQKGDLELDFENDFCGKLEQSLQSKRRCSLEEWNQDHIN
jgi:hypothetical protein